MLKLSKQVIISKKFFTISSDLIEFWELDSFMLRKMYAIYVPGLRDPDLCNHSLMAEILCLYSSNAFDKIQKYESLFNYVDSSDTRTDSMHHDFVDKEMIKEKDKNMLYKKKILNNNIQDNKLKTDIDKENFNFGALLFFSLNDGEFLNYISENVCGHSVEVLASNSSMTVLLFKKYDYPCGRKCVREVDLRLYNHIHVYMHVFIHACVRMYYTPEHPLDNRIARTILIFQNFKFSNVYQTIICGDDKGFVRILRNNPKFDDFEIRNSKQVNVRPC
ncbi:conserved Plasmodium protein, unknown function [Plasmodium malariae]|uniref:Uncharacterized protein n=1 Tax=Plasmodium malariae TaxID=5858 RepID=A0A1A8X5U7_PLAMA|nr:conserved Plasmodium protein, unknown function [Plasmodium malariae]